MSIITLTSDLGNKDYYLPSLKANILSQIDNVNIVDISHEIDHFNILQGAFVLKNCYKDFPRDTVHIIAIDDEISAESEETRIDSEMKANREKLQSITGGEDEAPEQEEVKEKE